MRSRVFLLQVQRYGELLECRENKEANKESEEEHDDRDQCFHGFAPDFEKRYERELKQYAPVSHNITSHMRDCKYKINKKTVKSEKGLTVLKKHC